MEKGSTLFLKIVIIFIGAIVLTALLWEPHLEGRNKNADLFTIYFKDLFLAYVYLTFVPFFCVLIQAFKFLGHIEQNTVFSPLAVKCLRNIKLCSMGMSALFAGAMGWVIFFAQEDDAPGAIVIGLVVVFAAFVVGIAAGLFQSLLQKAADIKSQND